MEPAFSNSRLPADRRFCIFLELASTIAIQENTSVYPPQLKITSPFPVKPHDSGVLKNSKKWFVSRVMGERLMSAHADITILARDYHPTLSTIAPAAGFRSDVQTICSYSADPGRLLQLMIDDIEENPRPFIVAMSTVMIAKEKTRLETIVDEHNLPYMLVITDGKMGMSESDINKINTFIIDETEDFDLPEEALADV